MSHYRSVTQLTAEKLVEHQGHKVEIVAYGLDGKAAADYALECVKCSLVLADFELSRMETSQ